MHSKPTYFYYVAKLMHFWRNNEFKALITKVIVKVEKEQL